MNIAFKNNFDFFRLVAATMVLVSHQFPLSGLAEPLLLPGTSFGTIAVEIFFVISGYLIAKSWSHDPHLVHFFIKRFLRLIPALLIVTLVTVFILGPLNSTLPINEYFSNKTTWQYLSNIYLDIRYGLPGVFNHNPLPNYVNGSLWSLPLEAQWYGIVAILGLARVIRFPIILFSIFGYLVWWEYQHLVITHLPGITSLWYLGIFFSAGMVLTTVTISKRIYFTVALICLVLFALDYWFFANVIFLPMSVIYFGTQDFSLIGNWGKWGDISYGTYLFAFPVQQSVVNFLGLSTPFLALLGISLLATYFLAYCSWRWIESPALKLKRLVN